MPQNFRLAVVSCLLSVIAGTGVARSSDGVDAAVAATMPKVIEWRRDFHQHPELGNRETRTAGIVAAQLQAMGIDVHTGIAHTGVVGVLHGARPGPTIALRADMDALPVTERVDVPFKSTVTTEYRGQTVGVMHACGHDVHTAAVLGAGLALAELAATGELGGRVRLIFQPAEEIQPGGSIDVMGAGALDGVRRIFALHCDPKVDVGHVGTRIGPITSASDSVYVTLRGPGGHTSRPHLTADVVFALGQVITQVPAVLGRRLDPRSGVNLTWGSVRAGSATNAIPSSGVVTGTLRCLDVRAWETAADVFEQAVREVVEPYGVELEVRCQHGVPPVVNEDASTGILEAAARDVLGTEAVELTEQSLGGEDFAWYLTRVPGAMGRLGTRGPGGRTYDIHQGDLRIDERAIEVGSLVLARAALLAGRH
jgi:amidohydrolase